MFCLWGIWVHMSNRTRPALTEIFHTYCSSHQINAQKTEHEILLEIPFRFIYHPVLILVTGSSFKHTNVSQTGFHETLGFHETPFGVPTEIVE